MTGSENNIGSKSNERGESDVLKVTWVGKVTCSESDMERVKVIWEFERDGIKVT